MQPRDAKGRFLRQDLRRKPLLYRLEVIDWFMICIFAGTLSYIVGRYAVR